ncbi:MAG: DRTGG domain-containing protein [Thermodesulfobacteriota bacterium]|jgi:predicted membrane-bound dolichyl-phosphate-mannose-protein mannosyltransferase
MKLKDIVKNLGAKVETTEEKLDRDVTGGYMSDLLSDVMANSKEGDVWITLQVHPNIIAVATLKDLAGIIIVQGRKPEKETIEKAQSENIPILVSDLQAFEIAGRLYQMGISGMR